MRVHDKQEDSLSILRRFEKYIAGVERKKDGGVKEICMDFLVSEGKNVRFLPMERMEWHPSIVRKSPEEYSVGISLEHVCSVRCYAAAIFILCREKEQPGFLEKYIKKNNVIDEFPYRCVISGIQSVLDIDVCM